MTYDLISLKVDRLPSDLLPGELVLLRKTERDGEPQYYVHIQRVGQFLRLGKVRFDERSQKVEVVGEITVHSSRRHEFARVLGFVAVRQHRRSGSS